MLLIWTTEDEVVGWDHWLSGREFEQTPGDGEGQGSPACCSPWGQKELDWLSDWTTKHYKIEAKLQGMTAGGTSGNRICLPPVHKRCGFDSWTGKIPGEEEMATHSRILAWEAPWTVESGGLQSAASQSRTRLSYWAVMLLATQLLPVPSPMGDPFHAKYTNVFTDFMETEILDLSNWNKIQNRHHWSSDHFWHIIKGKITAWKQNDGG